jgi:protein SCO1/2
MKRFLRSSLVGLGMLIIGVSSYFFFDSKAPLRVSVAYPTPQTIGRFSLENHDGTPFTQRDLVGHWSLLFAGYTSCADVCPTTLAKLAYVLEVIDHPGLRVLMLSVDPERDTLIRLRDYMHYFGHDMLGLRAKTHQDLEVMMRQVGFIAQHSQTEPGLINHSAGMVLFNPSGQMVARFQAMPMVGLEPVEHQIDAIIFDLELLLHNKAKT